MTILWLMACGSSTPATTPPTNEVPQAELRCKAAVERATVAVHLRDKDVTMAIGECEQKEWSRPARECIAAAHAAADLATCGTTYSLGAHGIFADPATFGKAMKAMRHFRDELCKCKDSACAQHVSDDMTKWGQEMAKDNEEPPRMTDEETKEATEIGEAMGKCMQQAMSSSTP